MILSISSFYFTFQASLVYLEAGYSNFICDGIRIKKSVYTHPSEFFIGLSSLVPSTPPDLDPIMSLLMLWFRRDCLSY